MVERERLVSHERKGSNSKVGLTALKALIGAPEARREQSREDE